jgi:hypothetical protein
VDSELDELPLDSPSPVVPDVDVDPSDVDASPELSEEPADDVVLSVLLVSEP